LSGNEFLAPGGKPTYIYGSELEREGHLFAIDIEGGKQRLAASKRDIASLQRDLSAKQQEVIDLGDEIDRLETEIQLAKIGRRFAPRARGFVDPVDLGKAPANSANNRFAI